MLHKRSIKEKLLKGGAWAFAGKLVTAFSGLAISALLARLLTPEDMGAYFLTLSLVSAAAVVAQLGLTQAIVRLVAESMGTERPSRARQSVLLALRIVAFSGLIVACLLAFGVGEWLSEQVFKSVVMSQVMGLAAVWAVIITFQSLMAEVYRGFHDIRLATIFGGLTTSVLAMSLFLGLWLFQGQSNLDQIIMLTVGAGLSSVLISSALLWNKLKVLPNEESSLTIKEILKISWSLWISQMMVLAILQADIWIVGAFLTEKEVALYGASTRLVSLLMMVATIFYGFMPPIISEMKVKNEMLKLQSVLTTSAFISAMIILPVFLCFIFFSKPILNFVYGEYYIQAASILSVLAVGFFFNAVTGMRGIVLMLTGYEKIQMIISIIGGIMNISFCTIGALKFGMIGVAYGAMLGVVLQSMMELIAVKKNLGIWTFATPIYYKEFILLYTNKRSERV